MPLLVHSLEYPKVNSKIVEIYDLNDEEILYSVDADKIVSIASLTKIATTITAIENIDNLDEVVTITSKILNTVSWDASRAGLKAGDKLTYRDLLYASMLPSGADATNSIAILSTGSIENFVNKMNELAERIGLSNTHFANVTGLDNKNHYSTADDVRKLLKYSLENQLFKEIFTTKEYQMSNGLKVKTTLNTYNKNSKHDTSSILGSKTGFTLDAGYCLASLSNINGHEMLIIVLHADKTETDFYNIIDTLKIINFMNQNYKEEVLIAKETLIKDLPVELSNTENYQIYATKDITKYLPSDYNKRKFHIEYDGLEKLSFKNKEGDKIGTINYYFADELIYSEDVILNTKIELSIAKVFKKFYLLIIAIVIILIIVLFSILKHHNKPKKKKRINTLKKALI